MRAGSEVKFAGANIQENTISTNVLGFAADPMARWVWPDSANNRSCIIPDGDFRSWQILLQKSFWGGERKFLEPLMQFARGDVRDHIVSSKNRSRTSVVALKRDAAGEVQRSAFARILGLFDFRLLQQYRHFSDIARCPDPRPLCAHKRTHPTLTGRAKYSARQPQRSA